MNDKVTRVINIRHDNSSQVYIGRGGFWGNPFQIGPCGSREDVVRKHREWLDGKLEAPSGRKPPSMDLIRKHLAGKILGCFCKPKACHGDNYVKICRGKTV